MVSFTPLLPLKAISAALVLASIGFSLYVGHPDMIRRSQITADQLSDDYDFIIIGGGQAGTVIGTRLSEDPQAKVLIVEFGDFIDDPAYLTPGSFITGLISTRYRFNLTSTPQEGLNGRAVGIYAAAAAGGGSAINGMLLNRGSAADYNSWEAVGNPGWGWDGLYPYFIKSSRFDAPAPAAVDEYDFTWGEESYDADGPIHLSFASWQWPGTKIQRAALIEAGAEPQIDGSGGNSHGLVWWPTALDNATAQRSYAVNGYYEPASARANLHFLTGWRVDKVEFDERNKATGVVITERDLQPGPQSRRIAANLEVVVTAGAIHTPQVLQRSGVGPAWLLEEAGIDVKVDLPGVGSNLQDHAVVGVSYNYTTNVLPNPDVSLSNATFVAWAQKELDENHSGPLRISTGNTGGLLPLPLIDPSGYKAIAQSYLAQDAAEYLPPTYTSEQIDGYNVVRKELASLLLTSNNAWAEVPLQGASSFSSVLMKTASRGTVLLNTADIYAEPVVDYNTYQNPIDLQIMTSNLRFVQRFHETEALQALGPVPLSPSADQQTEEGLRNFLKAKSGSSVAHNSGTAILLPRKLGGVVDSELLVYGTKGLSVADSSIIPVIPAAHICSTVYAIAEKAADIIKKRHGLA